ncbi:MAG: aminoglycoside phosphotransferase family protein [Chloroflexi bacterium]|nr:aminoglycoside phosphotransferase family protein [Chloroflexota bacterium]
MFGPIAIVLAGQLPWGFRNEVWRVELADGRRLAVTRFADARVAPRIVSLTRDLRPPLEAAGVPVPAVHATDAASAALLVTDFVDGAVGAAVLEEPGGPGLVGSLLGATWRRLATVDPSRLDIDATWTRPAELAVVSEARLDRSFATLTRIEKRWLAEAIATLPGVLADRPAGFVHGDLAPVNILVRDGRLAALVDLEFARIGEPLLDAGWFDLIMAVHHPADEPVAWQAFASASGAELDDPVSRYLLRLLPLVRILEILDDPVLTAGGRAHWLAFLRAGLAAA